MLNNPTCRQKRRFCHAGRSARVFKLKAFTLVEVLVVMILSVIVVAISYLVYDQMHLFSLEYEKKTHLANEMLTLDQHLRFDSQRADEIIADTEGFTFLVADQSLIAKYESNAAGIRRSAGELSDMFNLFLGQFEVAPTDRGKQLTIYLGEPGQIQDTLEYLIAWQATAKASQLQ